MKRVLTALTALILLLGSIAVPSWAGTTGVLSGKVSDGSGSPVAGVAVKATSPSQTATATTDAGGNFRFLSLGPDVYTLTLQKDGYATATQTDIAIFADQVETLAITLQSASARIGGAPAAATTVASATSDLVKHGSVSDVYSVSAATQHAVAGLTGQGSLNQAYSAIASVPGAVVGKDETGWYQEVRIRGGDNKQVGYEVDGVPVNFVFQNDPQHLLSTLGQQELQVYTGGIPASADAQSLAGYINQVIKTGTYPGTASIDAAIGAPTFYHTLSLEAGGSTPDRRFSYYVGADGINQGFRYINNNNGANLPGFQYPVNVLPDFGGNGVAYTGNGVPAGTPLFVAGNAFNYASNVQRDVVANLHYRIPHQNSAVSDEFQFLYQNSDAWGTDYSSINDFG